MRPLPKRRIAGLSVAGALVLTGTQTNAALADTKAHALLDRAGCMACHTIDTQGVVGPSFKEIALKNRRKPDAHAEVVRNVRQGVTGAYGNRPMPAISKRTISDADLSDIVEWILSR
jgi:cytochrome c551/c552